VDDMTNQAQSLQGEDDLRLAEDLRARYQKARDELAKLIVGQDSVVQQVLITILAGGNSLIVGVPGLAKTLLIHSIAQVLDLRFSRIQFTPDLMPSDITGTDLVQENPDSGRRELVFLPGPIFANIVLADEIYDKIVYDDARYIPLASLAGDDLLVLTFSGLSKSYRAAGFRTGWLLVSGAKQRAQDYIEGLDILASMRLCANVPTQHAVQTALGGYQSIDDLVAPGGRLRAQRDAAWEMLNAIDGIDCVKPRGALYLFPRLNVKKFNITDDERFVYDLLVREKVLLVQGTGFNWKQPDHFRVVFLPHLEELEQAMMRLERFLSTYRQ